MADIRKHFEAEAAIYDANIVRLIPHYGEMLDALVSALPFGLGSSPRVLDLGSGTGTLSARILERYPEAEVVCLDMAAGMLSMAQAKLASSRKVSFVQADFSSWEGEGKFDAVVSSLALHHLIDDGAKRVFFAKVKDLLAPGGSFVTADVVLSSDPDLQGMYLKKWRDYMLKAVSASDVDDIWFPSYEREDRPAVLADQLGWLADTGFQAVDVIWKWYNFAVYGGKRPFSQV
jgi:tRNA (cmo5U34)-methyltransferase